nr:hypothetical protein [Tanacetum cinerariifolium]
NDDDDDEDYTIAVTSDFLIIDSLSMRDEHIDTIPEKESDEFNKSSVEDLIPNPSESEDFSDIESKCDMPDCNDSQTTYFSTFSNTFFDDSTSSDEENRFHWELMKPIAIPKKIFILLRDYHITTHLLDRRKNLFLKILMLKSNLFLHLLSPLRIVTLIWKKLIYPLIQMTQCHRALRMMTMTPKGILFL